MLINLNKESNKQNKFFNKIDEANRALHYCPLNRADDQDKEYMQRAKEIARMNIYNAFFDNISILKTEKKNREIRSFCTNGTHVSVHLFLRHNFENKIENAKSQKLVETGNLVGIDPGHTTILTGVEHTQRKTIAQDDQYNVFSNSCNDYYASTLVNVANIQMDMKISTEMININKKMPSLKVVTSRDLLESIR